MTKAGEFRQRAEGYRRLKRQITDPAAVRAIIDLVDEYEMMAVELEKRHQIRDSAHEIWIERGRPEVRDVAV